MQGMESGGLGDLFGDPEEMQRRLAEFAQQMQGQECLGPQTVEPGGLPMKADGNNVSLDRETRLLAENALRFSVATSLARSQLHAIQSAIEDGKSA